MELLGESISSPEQKKIVGFLNSSVRIRMFLGLLDVDSLVRGTDPDPFIVKQNVQKNLIPTVLLLLYSFLS
jgi:hypothetical protein